MTWLVLVLLSAAPEDPPEREIAIFTSPLSILGAPALSFLANRNPCCGTVDPLVFIPFGASFTSGEIEWSMDAAIVSVIPTGFTLGFTGFWLGFGPVIHSGTHALGGVFLTPKVTVGAFRISALDARQPSDGQTMFDFLLGFDFGYQFTVGRLYFAFVLGVSVGAGYKENDSVAGPWLDSSLAISQGDRLSPVLGLNVQLFRIGYTF